MITLANRRKHWVLLGVLTAVVVGYGVTQGFAAEQPWQVRKGRAAKVTVDTARQVRSITDKAAFFGFNLNHFTFQRQLWDSARGTTKGDVTTLLRQYFPGSRYRYPGGMVANGFQWRGSLGHPTERMVHRNLYGDERVAPQFGIDEYLTFLDAVDGGFWYVLNLVGLDPASPWTESDGRAVAEHNAKLASYLLAHPRVAGGKRYYQLGNELDRSRYEWPHDKVAARAKETIDAIAKVDNDAEFVAFLREFKYRYKRKSAAGGNIVKVSTPQALMNDVLSALPNVSAYSLMQYYDGLREDGKNWSIRFWLTKLNESLHNYRQLRAGAQPKVWITEHARQSSSNQPGKDNTRRVTSNLGAAIASADYLIAMMQVPAVEGAFWHGLNAGPWQLFDAGVEHRDYRPRPIFWALAMLRSVVMGEVYETIIESPNFSAYDGGYDIRAVAFGNSMTGNDAMSFWLINRAMQPLDVHLTINNWQPRDRDGLALSAERNVRVTIRAIHGQAGVNPDDPRAATETGWPEASTKVITFDAVKQIPVTLKPSSVTALTLIVE